MPRGWKSRHHRCLSGTRGVLSAERRPLPETVQRRGPFSGEVGVGPPPHAPSRRPSASAPGSACAADRLRTRQPLRPAGPECNSASPSASCDGLMGSAAPFGGRIVSSICDSLFEQGDGVILLSLSQRDETRPTPGASRERRLRLRRRLRRRRGGGAAPWSACALRRGRLLARTSPAFGRHSFASIRSAMAHVAGFHGAHTVGKHHLV